MPVSAPQGFRLALAAELAELGEASSLDALQEIHSRSLVEELDRSTRRYRLRDSHEGSVSAVCCGAAQIASGFLGHHSANIIAAKGIDFRFPNHTPIDAFSVRPYL